MATKQEARRRYGKAASKLEILFDDGDAKPMRGQAERCRQSGNTSADNQRRVVHEEGRSRERSHTLAATARRCFVDNVTRW